jgi:phosphoglycerate kinase
MEKELLMLEKVLKNPEKPCIFLFGGAKFSDVIVTIENVLANETADKILLTGLPANAFLKAEGYKLGGKNESALLEEGKIEDFEEIKKVLATFSDDIYLPVDFALSDHETRKEINIDELPSENNLYDIGDKTIEKFKDILKTAKSVFLSGPCGVFENPLFRKGTEKIFKFVAESEAFSIVGGGHTVAAVKQFNLSGKISHISTGGGSLEKFMMGEKLVVLEALKEAKKKRIIELSQK